MLRRFIYMGLIAMLACTTKSGIDEPTTVTSLPQSTVDASFAHGRGRVDSKTVPEILKGQGPNPASYPKSQTDIINDIPNSATMKSFLEKFDTKPFQEYGTGLNDTTIRLQEGTIIKIPSNAFITKKNGQRPPNRAENNEPILRTPLYGANLQFTKLQYEAIPSVMTSQHAPKK